MSSKLHLIKKIKSIQKDVKPIVDQRITEFQKMTTNNQFFHELCFCILTANTSAKMGMKMQESISAKEFISLPEDQLKNKLIELRCRFFNKRSEYIVEARPHAKLKDILSKFPNNFEKRDFLEKNIKGIGMKESSHFLRNTGHLNVAILDKHVKNLLAEYNIITKELAEKPLKKAEYLEIEGILQEFANELNLTQGELDFYLWYLKTGEIIK